jgi:hypothetical protein
LVGVPLLPGSHAVARIASRLLKMKSKAKGRLNLLRHLASVEIAEMEYLADI